MKYTKQLITLALGSALALPVAAQIPHRSYIELDGFGDHLSVPAHADFDISPTDSYTICLYLSGDRTITYASGQRLVSRRDTQLKEGDKSGYELLGLKNVAKDFFGVSTPDQTGGYAHSLNAWAGDAHLRRELRSWHHVAWVVDRSQRRMQLYIDGQLQRVGSDKDIEGWSSANGLPVLLGAGRAAGKATAFFGGKLDNIRFYKRALSAEEIKRDGRTERIAARTPGLVAAFDFDGYQAGASQITDATGRHTAELIGFGTKTQHPEVASYREYVNNASLVGRGKDQPIFSFNLGLRKPQPLHQLQLDLTGTTALGDISSSTPQITSTASTHAVPGASSPSGQSRIISSSPSRP